MEAPIKSVRPERDGTTGETTSHLTKAASCQFIGYSHSTKLANNASQVAGDVEGFVGQNVVCLSSFIHGSTSCARAVGAHASYSHGQPFAGTQRTEGLIGASISQSKSYSQTGSLFCFE
jgi:hypothetical protein